MSGTPEQRRAYYEANRERIKEKSRLWYAANTERARGQKRAYRQANRERLNEQGRMWHRANRERINEEKRAAARADPDRIWAQKLKTTHHMTPQQWLGMWEQQDGCCYLCGGRLPDNRSKVAVDHDHSHCGERRSCRYCRRGLSCVLCNTIIGLAGDDPARMQAIAANFVRVQALVQAHMATAPKQGSLFDDAVGL